MGEVGVSKLLQAVPEQLHLVVAGEHWPHDRNEAVLLIDTFDGVVEEGVMEILLAVHDSKHFFQILSAVCSNILADCLGGWSFSEYSMI